MSSQPPRRGQPDDTEDDGGRRLPMFPIFAGVIVAGLGIGALLSAFAARHAPAPTKSQPPLVVTVTPTPVIERPYSPPPSEATSATIAQTPQGATTATPAASPAATPVPKASATATPLPKPSASSSAPASAAPSRAPSPLRSVAAITPRPVASPPVAAPASPLAPPVNAPASPARVAQSLAPAAGDIVTANAQAVVRRFLEAVSHGDQAGANAALGGSGGRLSEEQYLDPTTRITSISSLRVSNGTKVEVELTTAKGQYFSTFTVQDTPKGAVITSHATIPVGGTTAK